MPIDEEKRTTLRKFAAVGAGSPLLGLADEEGESETREAIAGYVEQTPGAHFSKIRDDLSLATGETQYHLRRLLDTSELELRRDGDYKRYFVRGEFTDFEQVALGYLRRETSRAMLLTVLIDPDLTGAQLATRLDVSPATISTTASEMASAGLLDRETGYQVINPETVIALILRYADSFDDRSRTFAKQAPELFEYSVDRGN